MGSPLVHLFIGSAILGSHFESFGLGVAVFNLGVFLLALADRYHQPRGHDEKQPD